MHFSQWMIENPYDGREWSRGYDAYALLLGDSRLFTRSFVLSAFKYRTGEK